MTYYLYHIPGKKIGVTCDLNNRVTVQQGYTPDEYEILEKSDKIKIQFLENKNTFNEEEWSELYRLSENTYVEESEELKQKSAGAGLTDND